jgi:ATP-dependent helicase HrpB
VSASLPIDAVLPALHTALAARAVAVLEAPPGAGKTTRVPLALLEHDASWLADQRILLLEPRRLAARSAATFMARALGERVGDTVGYRVRGESRVSARTRVEVVTEGVLTRLLAHDPALEGVGAVLFDEFHERSLQADLGLALTLETQRVLRPELRVLVMSATLDGEAVAQLLRDDAGDAPVVRSDGRLFPVRTVHRPPRASERPEAHTARVVREALAAHEGDVLVFLPGAREITRTAALLGDTADSRGTPVSVHPLFGTMALGAQDAAIAPAPPATRKIVLATSIAETSLTIEGVRVVVDSGYSRVPRFDTRAGLSRLETVRVTRASADQRRGRAGRVAEGHCYRLWEVHEDAALLPRARAEILEADLTPLALELAEAGVRDASTLRWLDVPSSSALDAARALLRWLGALDASGVVTAHGRAMLALPVHPRLAHLLLVASREGQAVEAAAIAACLEERDVLRGAGGPPPSDLRLRVELVLGASEASLAHDLAGATVDRDAVRRVREVARDLCARLDVPWAPNAMSSTHCGSLLALAFPDRVARRRASGSASSGNAGPRYLLRGGTGAALPVHDALAGAEWLAVAELDGAPPEFRVVRAAPLTREEVLARFSDDVLTTDEVHWDDAVARVRAMRRRRLGAVVLDEVPLRDVSAEQLAAALLEAVRARGVSALPWTAACERLRERLAFVHAHDESWPDVSDEALQASLSEWLGPSLAGIDRLSQLEGERLREALLSPLDWSQRAALDRLAPTHLEVPSGSRIAVDYHDPAAPVLAVKLQEVFGWTRTPTLLDGRVPVTLHLLSPAQRPVQVTRDLAGFWRDGYFAVRKELRGRYPRHPWPDDPLSAKATRRAKPRGT